MEKDVLERFGAKHAADFGSIIPVAAGAPVGGYLGAMLGERYLKNQALGGMLGAVSGGILGKVLGDASPQAPAPPPAGPLSIDPTTEDIPDWALAGARLLRPAMQPPKTAASDQEGYRDTMMSDLLGPPYALYQGAKDHGPLGALKHLAGSSAGIGLGGTLGYGLGQVLPKASLWGVPLSTLLTGLGATIGGAKGFQVAREGLGALGRG